MNEQEMIAANQIEWDKLAWKRQNMERQAARFHQAIEEAANPDERDNWMEQSEEVDQQLDEVDEAMHELEDWLVAHAAPGWVSS